MWDGISWFLFAFPWWQMIVSIFLYVYGSFVYLLLRNAYLHSWPIFNLGCLFCYQVVRISYTLYIQVLYWLYGLQNILPIYELPFHFLSGVLSKAFNFDQVQLTYFFLLLFVLLVSYHLYFKGYLRRKQNSKSAVICLKYRLPWRYCRLCSRLLQ